MEILESFRPRISHGGAFFGTAKRGQPVGVNGPRTNDLAEMTAASMALVFNTNVLGPLLCCKEACWLALSVVLGFSNAKDGSESNAAAVLPEW